jgi:nitrogenase molybdenum-iron protein alpha/beta subunit
MFSALRIFLGMDDVLPVIVGSKGCAIHLRFSLIAWGEEDFDLGKRPISVLEYPLDKIVVGDYQITTAWIEKMKKLVEIRKPRLIVLMPTDPLTLSGTDMAGIANEVNTSLEVETTFLSISAISGANQWVGYDAALRALYQPLMGKKYAKRNAVNLVGWMWPSRRRTHEIGACIDMLKTLGIEVASIISGGSSLKDIENSMEAKANAMVCAALAGDLLHELEEHGMKLAGRRSPYGFSGTTEWLEDIGQALDMDIKDQIRQLALLYESQFQANKEILRGKKVFVSGGPGRLIGLLHTMLDYEVDIQAAALFWPHPWSHQDLLHMFEEHDLKLKEFIVSPSLYDLEEIAGKYEIDVWMGGYQEQHTCKAHGIPFVPITVYTVPHVGFEGAVNLGNKLIMALNGYSFTEDVFNAKEIEPCIHRQQ